MSNLEDLVPPLELCKKIPEGKFEDSCFVRPDNVPGNPVWTRGTNIYFHELKCGIKMFPAPTLQEILEDLPTEIKEETTFLTMYDVRNKKKGFQFGYTAFHKITKKVVQSRIFCAKDDNAVISALKLWMKINNPDPENENLEDKENE